MKKLVFATHNSNKLQEVKQMLDGLYEVISLNEVKILNEIPEEEDTLEGNALQKAKYVHIRTGMNVFADDTGLEVEALKGEPGVYSARYAGADKDADANMKKVLTNLSGISNRNAQFRTSIALIIDDKVETFEGIVRGEILENGAGNKGFGYDPIFKPEGYNVSFAEMKAEDKNEISHRGRAIQKLIRFLKNYA